MASTQRPQIGVSLCLLGEHCRYDGGHNHHALLETILAPRCELVPICPEQAIGLPSPREKLLLLGPVERPTLVGEESGHAYEDDLRAFARQWISSHRGLSGFVLQSRSPSCGVGSCWRRPAPGDEPVRDGTGLFAELLLLMLPGLPVREDTQLADEAACWQFLVAVEGYAQQLQSE